MHMQFLFMVMQMAVMGGMQVMPALVDARTIMKKDVDEALYSVPAWICSNCFIDAGVTLLSGSIFRTIVYAFGGLDWSYFGVFFKWVLLCILVLDSFFNFIAAVASTGQLAQIMCLPGMIMFMIYNGFLVSQESCPVFMIWALYCSPFYYCISRLAMDLYGDKPDCMGCQMVVSNFGFEDAPSETIALSVLIAMFGLSGFAGRCLDQIVQPRKVVAASGAVFWLEAFRLVLLRCGSCRYTFMQ